MACNRSAKAAAKSAAKNGLTEPSNQGAGIEAGKKLKVQQSLHELLVQDTKGIRRLMKLKSSKELIPGEELAHLLEMSPDTTITEPLEGMKDRFGEQAQMVLGKKGISVIQEAGNGNCSIKEVFMAMPPLKQNSPAATPAQRNLQRLDAIRTSGESVPGDEVVKLLGMKLGDPLVNSVLATANFGDRAKLAFGETAVGVVVGTDNGQYAVKELYIPPPQEMGAPPEKVVLKQADRVRIEVNSQRVHEAIKNKKRLSVFYSGPNGGRYYVLSPLDITTGKTKETENHHYLWLYSDKANTVLSMRMDRVLWARANKETFDPAEIMEKALKGKTPTWSLSRAW